MHWRCLGPDCYSEEAQGQLGDKLPFFYVKGPLDIECEKEGCGARVRRIIISSFSLRVGGRGHGTQQLGWWALCSCSLASQRRRCL